MHLIKTHLNFLYKFSKELLNLTENVILLGDFNLVLDPELDRQGVTNSNLKAVEQVKFIMQNFC